MISIGNIYRCSIVRSLYSSWMIHILQIDLQNLCPSSSNTNPLPLFLHRIPVPFSHIKFECWISRFPYLPDSLNYETYLHHDFRPVTVHRYYHDFVFKLSWNRKKGFLIKLKRCSYAYWFSSVVRIPYDATITPQTEIGRISPTTYYNFFPLKSEIISILFPLMFHGCLCRQIIKEYWQNRNAFLHTEII